MKVSKYMTSKLITVDPDMSVKDAFMLMQAEQVRHLPVLADGRLAGIISDRDLRRPKWADDPEDWTNYYKFDEDLVVADVMTKNPEVIHARDSILAAARILREKRYGAVPVLNRKEELVGILSAQDLLGALEEHLQDDEEE